MAQYQPEAAKSLRFIAEYEDHEKCPLEDMLCRSFTVDVERFGVTEEVELCPGGKDMVVNRFNRSEFIRLYIEWEFCRQCEGQLAAFKKGFERMVDKEAVKAVLDSAELEALICGQRKLNFADLRDTAIYANGFTPDCAQMKWLWEIVLEEWDDEKRRQLLSFSTGSDRAPVAGLRSLKFYIVLEGGDDDNKLPTSHTCFNQLLMPRYSSKDVLREKLQFAIDNATGFGMV